MRVFVFLLFGIISSRAEAAGGVYQCIPCPTGIDCPAGTNEADIAEETASQHAKDGVPVGSVIAIAINRGAEFDGWLLCDGQDIPVGAKYDTLRGLLGSTYGEGKVPDFRGMFLRGVGGNAAAIGTPQADSAPNITGNFSGVEGFYAQAQPWGFRPDNTAGNAFNASVTNSRYNRYGDNKNGGEYDAESARTMYFDASRASVAYGRRNEVAPANYAVYYYIKY
jgi:hypothetical protein